jgi:hypothetical protein
MRVKTYILQVLRLIQNLQNKILKLKCSALAFFDLNLGEKI